MVVFYLLFILLYLYIANRHAMPFLWQTITGQKLVKETCTDKKILNVVNKKTGLSLKHFYLYDGSNAWGFMAGIPGNPQLFLRRDIYRGDFSKDEMQWLLLHEAGHYKLWHTTREFIHELISLVFGIWVLSLVSNIYSSFFLAILLAVILGIYAVQVGKMNEHEAEKYALSRVDNPRGMIASGKRSIAGWKKSGRRGEKSLLSKLFDRWEITMYFDRIKMAEEKISAAK